MPRIDINCDMGEIPEHIADGTQEALMQHITSVNIACGGHAGDHKTMRATIRQALRWKVAIGAHPSYPDRAGFGRRAMDLPAGAVAAAVHSQIEALADIAEACGTNLVHVKPHGALYNQAVHNRALAAAIAEGVARFSRHLTLVGLAGSPMIAVFHAAGFHTAAEAFADRRYEPDGTLRARTLSDALITDPDAAAEQALHIARDGQVIAAGGAIVPIRAQTICIHGDTPGAVRIAEVVARALSES